LGAWIPHYTVLSIDTDCSAGRIETTSLPVPHYTDAELAPIEPVLDSAWRRP